jgi:3-hydroxybutyryl-CoA dehydrogenase
MGNIRTVGVIGSGIMGSGLAEVAARAEFEVVVRSRTQAGADAVLHGIDAGLTKQVARERMTDDERHAILGRISVTDDLHQLHSCDLVIESIVEDMEAKRDLFEKLDRIVKPEAIIATNTSTLAVVELAVVTERPDKVCGIHFFNPAPVMSLVEIVRPVTASDETIADATRFATGCGKDAVLVEDRAGFIVNALLFPYLNNAIRMSEYGTASMESIDIAMQGGCGFPMGPFALLDLVGLDTSLAILDALYDEFRDANYAAAPTLRRKVAAGQLGRKSGRGFYDYG